MKKDKLSAIDRIKALVNFKDEEVKLEEQLLPDGTVLFAESFAVGEAVFVVNETEERIPLPVGEYILADGKVIVVAEEGIIAEVKDAPAEEGAEMSEELQKAIEKTVAETLEANKKLTKENEELKAHKLKAVTLSKGVKQNPEGSGNIVIPRNPLHMSVRERVHMAMEKTPFYNNVQLATVTDITTTYAGEFAGSYIRAATLQGVTLGSRIITVKENIKLKEVVKKVATAGILADASCAFTDTGTVDITERILTPKELQVNLELCKTDFAGDWEAVSMGYSAFDVLPPNFQSFFAEQMAGIVNEAIEISIYQGDAGNAGEFDGFDLLLAADTDVVDVDNAAIAIDETNVIAELGKVADAIPQSIYNTEDLVILVAPNIGRAYMRALGGFGAAGLGGSGYLGQGPTGAKPLNFDGIPLFIGNGMTATTMIAGQSRNLWYGTGVLNDTNEVKILDMADLDGSKNVRFVMRFTGGVQYGIGTEIVYYWNETP